MPAAIGNKFLVNKVWVQKQFIFSAYSKYISKPERPKGNDHTKQMAPLPVLEVCPGIAYPMLN